MLMTLLAGRFTAMSNFRRVLARNRRMVGALAMVLPVIASALVFGRVTRAFFSGDDFVHLYRAANEPWRDFFLDQWGGHMITAFSAVVAALYASMGPRAGAFFGLVFATHLANVLLLFDVVRRLTGGLAVAATAAVLWGTCPLHGDTLTWFSVYGQVLATTALLVAFEALIAVRAGDGAGWGPLGLLAASLVTGALLFGTGIALALVFPLVAWLFGPAGVARRRLLGVALGALAVVVAAYVFTRPAADPVRNTVYALTSLQGLLLRLGIANAPSLAMHGIAALTLGFLDRAPTGGIAATAAAVWTAALCAALGLATVRRRREILASVAIALAIYGLIGVGRTILYLAWNAGDLAVVPRYHYMATAALAVASGLALDTLGARAGGLPLVALAGAIASVVAGCARSDWHLNEHADARAGTAAALAEIRRAAAAAPPGTVVRVPNRAFPYRGWIADAVQFPGLAAVFLVWERAQRVGDTVVVFVEPREAVRAAAATGRRSRGLLVPPAPS